MSCLTILYKSVFLLAIIVCFSTVYASNGQRCSGMCENDWLRKVIGPYYSTLEDHSAMFKLLLTLTEVVKKKEKFSPECLNMYTCQFMCI